MGTPHPHRNGKNCRNMMLFSKALFLATSFPEIVGNSIFYCIFFQKFRIFLRFSQPFVIIVQTPKNHRMVFKFHEKYEKKCILQFHYYFIRKSLKISQSFPTLFCFVPKRTTISIIV